MFVELFIVIVMFDGFVEVYPRLSLSKSEQYSERFIVDEHTGDRIAPRGEKQKTMLKFFKEGFTPKRGSDDNEVNASLSS